MILALILQAASAVTLSEARAMSPSALAARLLPEQRHGPIVDAIVNGRGGLTPPSRSVNHVWLIEQMVPFDTVICRSHVFDIEMDAGDPAATPYTSALATHPVKVGQYDRLWVPRTGKASKATCAAAPATASGFGDGGFGSRQASNLVEQARAAFALSARQQGFTVTCRGNRDVCGQSARETLAHLNWSLLGSLKQVDKHGEEYYVHDPRPVDAAWGPAHVQFTFPYAATQGDTWVITVDRTPSIKAIHTEAQTIIYE